MKIGHYMMIIIKMKSLVQSNEILEEVENCIGDIH